MSEIIFGIVFLVIIFAAVLFGIAVGCCAAKKDKAEDFFIKRDHLRQQVKELKAQLEKERAEKRGLYKDNVILRQELEDSAEEVYELRFNLRKLETAKERGNDGK